MAENPLHNLKDLKESMKQNEWMITAFEFNYKKIRYLVLVNRFQKSAPQYMQVRLTFINSTLEDGDSRKEMTANANTLCIDIDPKKLREFFNISYSENLGDVFKQFYERFGAVIPTQVNGEFNRQHQDDILRNLPKSENDDGSKPYCFDVRRNGSKRSEYNSTKMQLINPQIYIRFADDEGLSFFFCNDKSREASIDTLISNVASRENGK